MSSGILVFVVLAADLVRLKGSNPRKLALAKLLWTRKTISLDWIVNKLTMRNVANVNQQLRWMSIKTSASQLSLDRLLR